MYVLPLGKARECRSVGCGKLSGNSLLAQLPDITINNVVSFPVQISVSNITLRRKLRFREKNLYPIVAQQNDQRSVRVHAVGSGSALWERVLIYYSLEMTVQVHVGDANI